MEVIDLSGRKGLVAGIANVQSLAWSATEHFHRAGAELAVTLLNDKAKTRVAPLAERIGARLLVPCNTSAAGEVEAVFATIPATWERLDFLFHSILWGPKEDLHGRLTDCSADGFAQSMLIWSHSFIRMAKLAEPLMDKGGSLMTLNFLGAEKVVKHYNVMGTVKAALEASVRYLAHELGPTGIRINAISAGSVATCAAFDLEPSDELLNDSRRKAPPKQTIDGCEVGRAALMAASDYGQDITGEILHVDDSVHIEGMVFH